MIESVVGIMRTRIFLFLMFGILLGCQAGEKKLKNNDQPLSELISGSDNISIKIDKSEYVLSVLQGDEVMKEYQVVFGGNAIDDKLREGDECTPEGEFNLVSKYPHKSWHKFMWINYPTPESWKKHEQAKAEGKLNENASIGGEIGIHGVPEGMDYLVTERHNWTLGCIALINADLDEIYPFIDKQTSIIIQK